MARCSAPTHAMRIGIVACGYADGYPRHAPNGTPILVEGQRTGTLGRVSMDMLYADLSALPQAGVGSRVVLWGEGLPIEEVARAAATVSYELMCALTPRVQIELLISSKGGGHERRIATGQPALMRARKTCWHSIWA